MSTSQNCSCCRQASVQEQPASVKPAATAETDLASDAERASSRLFSRRATLVTGALASRGAGFLRRGRRHDGDRARRNRGYGSRVFGGRG